MQYSRLRNILINSNLSATARRGAPAAKKPCTRCRRGTKAPAGARPGRVFAARQIRKGNRPRGIKGQSPCPGQRKARPARNSHPQQPAGERKGPKSFGERDSRTRERTKSAKSVPAQVQRDLRENENPQKRSSGGMFVLAVIRFLDSLRSLEMTGEVARSLEMTGAGL